MKVGQIFQNETHHHWCVSDIPLSPLRGKELELKIPKLYPEVRFAEYQRPTLVGLLFFFVVQVPLVPVHLFNKPVPGPGEALVRIS